ncbi:hypothetical protein QR77_18400 [Streptomyces sp. 150FB]|uniref:histidine phosphatase family protein n=1 Tax=Streptomyces sp. 150FB TaxID=1576605 RepID=UPI0005892EA0|nr:histidine phosphatase family protein [Streptomyces sp. 150FB]KIF75351.1 hypothetical protein QR77_18400 [Streptomyces sp. 150FB]
MNATLILLRHGESTANADGTFTGWTDVPLTPRGREQARTAGHLMYKAGLLPDVVHTSVLARTITTADIVHLDKLDPPDVENLNIPTDQPLRYDLDHNFSPRKPGGTYLDPDTAAAEAAAVRSQ